MNFNYTKIIQFIALVVIAFVVVLIANGMNRPHQQTNPADMSVGGSTDENGCLTAAGYSWDTEVSMCVRSWEREISIASNGIYTADGFSLSIQTTGTGNEYTVSMKGCNSVNGTATYDNDTQTLKGGPFMSTKMACADEQLMNMESIVPAMIEEGARIQIVPEGFALVTPTRSVSFTR
jgi:hypothetical protein